MPQVVPLSPFRYRLLCLGAQSSSFPSHPIYPADSHYCCLPIQPILVLLSYDSGFCLYLLFSHLVALVPLSPARHFQLGPVPHKPLCTSFRSTVTASAKIMATLTVPSPQMVPASFGASRKFRPLSTHGMPKEPRTMSPERPHRFSTLGYPGQSFPSTPLSPRSPGPMSPPLSAKSFGTFIDSEPSTPAYSPRMDYDWDSSTLVLLRPMSSSSEPSSPSEPVWDMMTPMKLPSKTARTIRPKGPSIRTNEISSETSLSSHPVATTKTTRPPDIRIAPVRTQTGALVSQKREVEEEEKSRLQEEPDRNTGAAPLGKLASKMKLMLRRKNTTGKKKRTKEKDYYEVDHVDDVHWTEM